MRSLTSCEATDMKRLLWLSLLLTCSPGTESCLIQSNGIIWQKTEQSAVLPCTVRSDCSVQVMRYEWFVFKENEHFRLTLTGRHSLQEASLHIKSLQLNDSGIYHCAIVSKTESSCCKEPVGPGTTLVVRGHVKLMMRHILLWSSFALLVIYSLVIVMLILKKHGCNMAIWRKKSKSDKSSLRKKSQFHNVLQEMHSRGNLRKSKENTRGIDSQAEAASGESTISTDSIYQNV